MDPATVWQKIESEIILLEHLIELLGWDQETYMPAAAVTERAEQGAYLQGRLHRLWTSDETRNLIESQTDNGDPIHDARLRLFRRELKRRVCLPQELVERKARLVVQAQAAWAQARKESRFALFLPHLRELVDIARTTSQLLGWEDHPYTALLDEYEPGATTSELDRLFPLLAAGINQFLERHPGALSLDNQILKRRWRKADLAELNHFVLRSMGFDLQRGRLDETTHPFCTTLGADDIRLTTRYDLNFLPTSLYGTIHEMGHGLYEQGFGKEIQGTILARGTSLGIHESQSRFWENMIARSPEWVSWFTPHLSRLSHHVVSLTEGKDLALAVNKVERSLIRVEADEVTYSLHIILRYGLEKDLLSATLAPENVPEAWNHASQELLGITPGNDAEGCLQDIHWSMGGLGYFPTYALGNLYAAQFRQAMKRDLPLQDLVARGEFQPVLDWLRNSVHRWGSVLSARELVRQATGQELGVQPFLDYLDEKYQALGV